VLKDIRKVFVFSLLLVAYICALKDDCYTTR